MINVVVLDRNALAGDIQIGPLSVPHTWTNYANTRSDQVQTRLTDTEVAILSKTRMDKTTLEGCPSLKHIAVAATGYNTIDLAACQRLGITVSNIPSYAATTVAEHVIGVSLSLRRKLIQYRQKVIDGAWQKSPGFCLFDKPVNDLNGAIMGIIGLGDIGQTTAKLAAAMGMRVIFCARRKIEFDGAEQVDFNELIKHADIISLHCSLNTSTADLISTKELAQMQEHAILINTARGGIVNETALVEAITSNQIGGAAVDVLVEEPPKDHSPLLSIANRSNVIITPHIAWSSRGAMQDLTTILINNIEAYLAGKPVNLVTA